MEQNLFEETCSCNVTCELCDIKDALEIWFIKPHVVNRRLAGSVTVFTNTIHEQFEIPLLKEMFQEMFQCSQQSCESNQNTVDVAETEDVIDTLVDFGTESQQTSHKTDVLSSNQKTVDITETDNSIETIVDYETESQQTPHETNAISSSEISHSHDNAQLDYQHKQSTKKQIDLSESLFTFLSDQICYILKKHYTNDASLFDNVVVTLRKLLPRNIDRYLPTYELILTLSAVSDITTIFVPVGMENDATPLFHRSHYVHFDSRLSRLHHNVFKDFENEVPSTALVPTRDWLVDQLIKKLKTWSEASFHSNAPLRKSQSLELVDIEEYTKLYTKLKKKYGEYFVKIWSENTDPLKYVYEDIAIATYLLLLWTAEREHCKIEHKQSFVDLGCGNGLLVHLLSNEGHPGRGVDITRRKIWDLYGEKTTLQEVVISPDKLTVDEDWIVGNHSDELTPWIPVIAARSSYHTKYLVLPCCFHDFYGKFHRSKQNKPQYEMYLEYVRTIGEKCGFNVEQDVMRIPSTKRVCQVGRSKVHSVQVKLDLNAIVNQTCNMSQSNHEFKARQVTNDPKNCSHVNKQVKEIIINSIIQKLLSSSSSGTKDEIHGLGIGTTSTGVLLSRWNKGGSVHLNKLVLLFDSNVLKELKSQCGGLQTLLKNHRHIFKVVGGMVSLRDYRNPEDTQPSYRTQMKRKYGKNDHEKQLKTKICWFHANHPHGCVLNELCKFAHGEEELRVFHE